MAPVDKPLGSPDALTDYIKKLEQRIADIAALIGPLSSQATRFGSGTGTATWAGNRYSAEMTVTHGLGWTPTRVWVTGSTDQGTAVIAYQAFSYGATTFKVRGDFTNGSAPTGSSTFVWLAEQ